MHYFDEVKARLNAATPGVWSKGSSYGAIVSTERTPLDHANSEWPEYDWEGNIIGTTTQDESYGGVLIAESIREHNSPFLSHAKGDVTHLLNICEALRDSLGELIGEDAADEIVKQEMNRA